jgi:crossover junction endodeoxyribonuclease RusA
MTTITLPFPPSVNTYWRSVKGRNILSKKAREYQNVCAAMLLGTTTIKGSVFLSITLVPPDNRHRDSDNYNKALFDVLVKNGVIEGDSNRFVRGHMVVWNEPDGSDGRAVVTVSKENP